MKFKLFLIDTKRRLITNFKKRLEENTAWENVESHIFFSFDSNIPHLFQLTFCPGDRQPAGRTWVWGLAVPFCAFWNIQNKTEKKKRKKLKKIKKIKIA